MNFYVQVRRGGFMKSSPWGEKGSPFASIEMAKEHIKDVAEMAYNYNCVIDYQITDDNGIVVEKG